MTMVKIKYVCKLLLRLNTPFRNNSRLRKTNQKERRKKNKMETYRSLAPQIAVPVPLLAVHLLPGECAHASWASKKEQVHTN